MIHALPFNPARVPVFINVRDRLTDLRSLVAWLEGAGHQRIVLLDNDSRYEPLVEYLRASPHEVRYLRRNYGPMALWLTHKVPRREFFVYSDPDVVPLEACPSDLIDRLHSVLRTHKGFCKAGPGIFIEDVAEDLPCLEHERGLCSERLAEGVYRSEIDTTFALYWPKGQHAQSFDFDAIRLGFPYQVRHSSFYRYFEPSEEELFYLARARAGSAGSTWALDYRRATQVQPA